MGERLTVGVAARLYGASSLEQQAVRDGWRDVGIRVSGRGSISASAPAAAMTSRYVEYDSLAALRARVDELAKTVDQLTNARTVYSAP